MRFFLLFAVSLLSLNVYSKDNENKTDKKVKKMELKADRDFISQQFVRAMEQYEAALKLPISNSYAAQLNLKTARLYLALLDYTSSIPHYEKAMQLDKSEFTPVDVCNYLDALRFSGKKNEAIKIARTYAYSNMYNKDQRYLNIVHALEFEDGFMPVGAPEYMVERLEHVNTPYSEFWVGKMKDEYFYASSNSKFHDPSKKFYHRTKYYSLDKNSKYSYQAMVEDSVSGRRFKSILDMIPRDLQNGPLSFSDDMTKIVVTSIDYKKSDQIRITPNGLEPFNTKLFYSEYDYRRRGWTSFREAFPQQEDASYAHPFLFNNYKSLLFSSDMAGGYGGYDLYVTHWNETEKRWGDPINLGAQVNTEGDEISPSIYDNTLIFASNGHVGYGGYDLYSIIYENETILSGSLVHFSYPINTVLNDFCMYRIDANTGYIVSDRQRQYSDDIYYFEPNTKKLDGDRIYGQSVTTAISNGTIELLANQDEDNDPKHVSVKNGMGVRPSDNSEFGSANSGFEYDPETGISGNRQILNVYFDFDKSNLNKSALDALSVWLNATNLNNIKSLVIDGYTDVLGSEGYNQKLSKQRAETVAKWLRKQGVEIPLKVEGRGVMVLNQNELDNEKPPVQFSVNESKPKSIYSILDRKIWMNRKARRVEIKAITK